MFLDSLPQTLTPLELGGAGAASVQQGLAQTLRAVLDVQVGGGPGGRPDAWCGARGVVGQEPAVVCGWRLTAPAQ